MLDRKGRVVFEFVEKTKGFPNINLPFAMLVMGDFSGTRVKDLDLPPLNKREIQQVTGGKKSINSLVAATQPTARVEVGGQTMLLTITDIDDFKPHKLVWKIPELARLMKVREMLKQFQRMLEDGTKGDRPIEEMIEEIRRAALGPGEAES